MDGQLEYQGYRGASQTSAGFVIESPLSQAGPRLLEARPRLSSHAMPRWKAMRPRDAPCLTINSNSVAALRPLAPPRATGSPPKEAQSQGGSGDLGDIVEKAVIDGLANEAADA